MDTGGAVGTETGASEAWGRMKADRRPSGQLSPQDRALHEADCWQLHAQLRDKAHQRVVLEAEESDLLLIAEECRLFSKFGYVCMAEYMERELGYGSRHAANERLRVAHELLELPVLREHYRAGELCFTKVRELSRVATRDTEEAYVEQALGKTAGQVQQLVSGKRRGDAPDAPPDPALIKHRIVLEVDAETFAMWRRMRSALDDEHGGRLSELALAQTLCRRAVEGGGERSDEVSGEAGGEPGGAPSGKPGKETAKPVPRPAVQLSVTTCRACKRAWASGAGIEAPLTEAQLERARCDAVHVGDLESDEPTRPRSEIPEPIRRKVFIRDLHACTVPGCRSTRNLDVHHLVPRERGGGHELWNLTVLCHGHHLHLHDGLLSITGRAPDALELSWRHDDEDEEGALPGRSPEGRALDRSRSTSSEQPHREGAS